MKRRAHLDAGTIIGRDFRVLYELASGGMGSIYVAEQLSTGKRRALKVLHPEFVADERTRARFAQEARIGSQIESDHVVDVVGAGIDESTEIPFLAMELLTGESLHEAIRRRAPFNAAEVLEVFRQLCHALAAAHRVNVVHRDLKPENIFLAAPRVSGMPFMLKVLDFGIAKFVQEQSSQNTEVIGSPRWMAPEQARHGDRISAATDVWALGLLAFRMLTRKHYFVSANDANTTPMNLMYEIAVEPLERASVRALAYGSRVRLDQSFDDWFSRCVDRDVSRRFQTADECLAGLMDVLGQHASEPPRAFVPMRATDSLGMPIGVQTGSIAAVGTGVANIARTLPPPSVESDAPPSDAPPQRTPRGPTGTLAPPGPVPASSLDSSAPGPSSDAPPMDSGRVESSSGPRSFEPPPEDTGFSVPGLSQKGSAASQNRRLVLGVVVGFAVVGAAAWLFDRSRTPSSATAASAATGGTAVEPTPSNAGPLPDAGTGTDPLAVGATDASAEASVALQSDAGAPQVAAAPSQDASSTGPAPTEPAARNTPPSGTSPAVARNRDHRRDAGIAGAETPEPAAGTQGTFDPGAFMTAFHGQLSGMRECYDRSTADHAARSNLDLTVVIGSNGRARNVIAQGLSQAPDAVECIKAVVRGIQFPTPPGGSIVMTFPLSFGG